MPQPHIKRAINLNKLRNLLLEFLEVAELSHLADDTDTHTINGDDQPGTFVPLHTRRSAASVISRKDPTISSECRPARSF